MRTGEDEGPGFGLPNMQAKVDGVSGSGGWKWPFRKPKKPGRVSKDDLLRELKKELKARGLSPSSKVTSTWEGLSEKIHNQVAKVKHLAHKAGVCLKGVPDVELAFGKKDIVELFTKIKEWLQTHLQDAGEVLFPCCCGRRGSYDITSPDKGSKEDKQLEEDLRKAADSIKEAASVGDPSFKERISHALEVLKRAIKTAKNRNKDNRQAQKLRETVDVGVQCAILDFGPLHNRDDCPGYEMYWTCQSSFENPKEEPIYENIAPWGEPWGEVLSRLWWQDGVDFYTEGAPFPPLRHGMIRCKLPQVSDLASLEEKERLLDIKLSMVDQTLEDLNLMWRKAEEEVNAAIAARKRIEESSLCRRIQAGLRRLFCCFCPPKEEE